MSGAQRKKFVDAAGAVLWRHAGADVEIAVIHRPRYDDWTLPKGKIDPGETAPTAAVREIAEETGVTARLGRRLARIRYPMTGNRTKRVDYWAAEALSGIGHFTAGDEVDGLRWLSPDAAAAILSHDADRGIIARFRELPADTETLLVVRHAKAGRRNRWSGPDELRPLERAGREQAAALVPILLAFGARQVSTANPVRCVQTVTPLAEALGVEIELEPALSETSYAVDPRAAVDRIRKIAASGGGRVVCSQGKVIPGLLAQLAAEDGLPLPAARNRKASFWVLSLRDGRIVAADHIGSPLPPNPM